MESESKITDLESNSSETTPVLPKLRNIPRRSAGSTVGFARSFPNALPSQSIARTTVATLTAKSQVINNRSATCSVVTSMSMSRRRQSVQCPIIPENRLPLADAGRRSRSLSTCTTACSAIHNTFIHCSTTELRSHRFRRAPRSVADPLALDVANNNDAAVSHESPLARDLQLNIVLGYNRTIHRKVANVKHPELLETVKSLPMTKCSNESVQNDYMHDTVAETQSPKSSSTRRGAAMKPRPRARKIKPKEIKPQVEKSQVGIRRKRNAAKKLVKVETTTSSTQTQIEDTGLWSNVPQHSYNIPSNVNAVKCTSDCQPKNQPTILVDGHLIEMKDELCFLTKQQLQPSDDASLDELRSLLSFLTPQQVHCLHHIHKVKRKDDLMYLNLWQLHKMGIHHPEIVLALMQVALSVNLHQHQQDNQTIPDNNCRSDDLVHDYDDCGDSQLVIDEEGPNTNDIQLDTHEQTDKSLALKTQNDLGNDFKELLTEVTEIANTVHDKLLIIKNQNLAPKDKYQKLWPLFELLQRQEKRVEILWGTLLNASDKVPAKENMFPSPQPSVTPYDEDCQQNVNEEAPSIFLPKIEEDKNNGMSDDEAEQVDAVNMKTACEFLPSDILECSLDHDEGVSTLEMPTTNVEMLKNKYIPPLAVNDIATTHDEETEQVVDALNMESACVFLPSDILECRLDHDEGVSALEVTTANVESLENKNIRFLAVNEVTTSHDEEDREDKIPKILKNESCSPTSSVYGEETEKSRELENERIIPHTCMDIGETTEYLEDYQDGVINSEAVMTPTILTYIHSNESSTSQEEILDNKEAMQNEETQIVRVDAPSPTILLSPTINSGEISFSEDFKQHTEHESNNVESLGSLLTLDHAKAQDIENAVGKWNVDCNWDEEIPLYEGIAVTNEKTPNKDKRASLPRKSPRLHSETPCASLSQSQESDVTPTMEPKKFKPRRLRIPKTSMKNVNDPRNKSKSTVYNVPDNRNQIKTSSSVDVVSPEQTVTLNNRYFRNATKSKSNEEEVKRKISLSSLPHKEVDNEDVELGMLAIHSDGGETNDNSDKCSHSGESSCETFEAGRSSEEGTQDFEVDNANALNRIAGKTTKMRRIKSRIVTTTHLDPRRPVSYEDVLSISTAPIVQIRKLKLPQKADSATTLRSSKQTSSSSKIVTTLKRRSLETDKDIKSSKVQRVDSLGNYLEDICVEYNQRNLDVLSPKNLQTKHVYEDMTTTEYYSSSDERPSDLNIVGLPSQDSSNAHSRTHIDIQDEYHKHLPQRRQEAESDSHQQIVNVNINSDLQQLHENERAISYRPAKTAAAVATNKELKLQQLQANKVYSTCNPYNDANVKEESDHQHTRSPSLTDVEGKENGAGSSQPHELSYTFSNAEGGENSAKENERNIERLSTYTSLHNKLSSSQAAKRQINFENESVNITPIASPTYGIDCISSPSPVRSGGSGILVSIDYQMSGEIDGRLTYPPIPYILFEVDISRKALDIKKLKTNSLDPRVFRMQTKKIAVTSPPSSSSRHQTFGTSTPMSSVSIYNPTFTNDPRYRIQHPELQSPLPSVSPQPSDKNSLVSYNMNSSLVDSNVAHHSAPRNMLSVPTSMTFAQPQLQNPVKVLHGYLQQSQWYQNLMSNMKMQINQTVSHLLRALNSFYRERELNPEVIFDIFKIDCAGEILEILSNLGLVVDSSGTIIEKSRMPSYADHSGTTMQQHGGTTFHQRGATAMQQHGGGSNAMSPVNATYSFIQQVLTKSLATASRTAFNATAGTLNEPFVSCYVEAPKTMGGGFDCGSVSSFMPQEEGCCGAVPCIPKSSGCNVGTTCTVPKGCGCSVSTTCMNHHQHQSPHYHQNQRPQQNYHRHQQDDMPSSETSDSHCGGNCNNDRPYNHFRKPYQNNNDSSQGSSYNQRYNNNSRYSKPFYSGADSNSPGRSGSSPSSSSRGGGRGGGRGRGRGGFGRYNNGPMRGGDGGDRPSSSWSSSPPPKGENSHNNRRFNNNNNDNNYNSSYNNSPSKTSSSPPPQRSPPPLSSPKQSGREGSPVLNSPARQQQKSRPPSPDEECWD